jgi:hypothetical protein
MAVTDHPTRTNTSNPGARSSWVLLGYAVLAAIAIAAAIYFISGGLEVSELDPSQLVGP